MNTARTSSRTWGAIVAALVFSLAGGFCGASADQEAPSFDPARTFPVKGLKADLQVLWDILEEGHGGFERYMPADALKKSFDAVGSGLTGPLTELDFYVRLLPLIAEIEDGHNRLALSSGASAYLFSRPVQLPFGIRFLGEKTYVLRDLSPAGASAKARSCWRSTCRNAL